MSLERTGKTKQVDRRVRKTKNQLRDGLSRLMEKKSIKEITVKELVDEVDINRSTFYLHYTDIYQMLEAIEEELMNELMAVIKRDRDIPFNEQSLPFIESICKILAENRTICVALLGPHGDIAFIHQMERIIAENSFQVIVNKYPNAEKEIGYAYDFCLAGCVRLIETWLKKEQPESVEYMANMMYELVTNALKPVYHHIMTTP